MTGAKDARADGLNGTQLFLGLLGPALTDERECAAAAAFQGMDMLGAVGARGDICDGLVLLSASAGRPSSRSTLA